MTGAARILLAGPLLVTTVAAFAQGQAARTADVTTEQIGQNQARLVPPVAAPADRRDPRNPSPAQVSDSKQAGRPVDQLQARIKPHAGTAQLAKEGKRASGSPQLGNGERSARGAQSISKPSDGRQTAIVHVGGNDRCDPQAREAGSAACKAVIETRSAEFKAPSAPNTTPEQRLLFDQERAEAKSVRGAVQRVGRNDIDPNAMETQTLAAITAGAPVPATQPPVADDPASASSLEAIIQIIGAAQGAQVPQ